MTVTNQLKVGKYEFMSHIHNCDQSVYKRYRTADHMCVDSIKIILIHRRPFDTQPIVMMWHNKLKCHWTV